MGGGILHWLGIHDIDLIQWLSGEPIVSVQAMTATMSSDAIDVEDTISIQFRLAGGAVGTMHFAYALPRPGGAGYMALRGSKASVTIDAAGATEWIGPGTVAGSRCASETHLQRRRRVARLWLGGRADRRGHARRHANDRDPLATGENARDALRVVDAAYASASTGRAVSIDTELRGRRSETMRETLRGVWVAMPTPWQADGAVDAGIVRELVQRYAAAGLHGAYTTGTDGEVHVMEVDELRQLAAPFASAAADGRIAGADGMRLVAHRTA